jgi:DNA-binding transcriptional MerR regulator
MRQLLEKERGRRYIGLPEFAQTGERILSQLALEQERGTVTSVPDERTIRYYLSEGLIESPGEKQGTASVFGYLNLLQLVVVKKLQAEHLPIRKIRELVADKSEGELETLLGFGGASSTKGSKKGGESEAKRYLESLLAPSMPESAPFRARTVTPRAKPTGGRGDASAAPVEDRGDPSPSWQRMEIEPGLELHIRSDYTPPATSAKSKGLVERISQRLRRLRGL